MKNLAMIHGSVNVEAHGSMAVLTCCEPYELRLLGTSCYTDCELYKATTSIMLSLEKGKTGVVILSVCTLDKTHYTREIFEVSWVGKNKDKIFVNLAKPLYGCRPGRGSVSENGLEVSYGGTNYRIPCIFWGDTEISVNPQKVIEYADSFSRVGHHLFRDGNAFCRYFIGDADISEIEAAHMEYKMEDPDFLKQIAKEVIVLRQMVQKTSADLGDKSCECQSKQKEIDTLKSQLDKTMKALRYIRDISLKATWNTWWTKLAKVRRVFIPFTDHYVDVDLK